MKNKQMNRKVCTIWLITLLQMSSIASCVNKSSDIQDRGIWLSLEEGIDIDGYLLRHGSVYGVFLSDSADYRFFDPLEGIDVESFKVCKGSGYAKDKNHVYYPLSTICEDGTDYCACYFNVYKIESADPGSFKYIGKGYAVDRKHMYYQGSVIPWDDKFLHHE